MHFERLLSRKRHIGDISLDIRQKSVCERAAAHSPAKHPGFRRQSSFIPSPVHTDEGKCLHDAETKHGGSDASSCNSSSGPTWLTDSCIGSTPARCLRIEAIERHELPHSYPSWVYPMLDELQQASPRCRSISQKERCPKSHLLSYRPSDMPLTSRPGKACGEIFRLRDDNMSPVAGKSRDLRTIQLYYLRIISQSNE